MADETQDLFESLARKRRQKKTSPVEQQPETVEANIPLQDIKDRAKSDTRSLNPEHVEALAESIAAVGLIQPLAIDNQGRLLAGGHRRAAIALLKKQDPAAYEKHFKADRVPVRAFDFDSEEEPDWALGIEVSENEQRRDYTPTEVKALAQRLLNAGYVDTPGRPKKGERQLKPALQVIIGKSESTVRRMLKEEETESKTLSSDRVSKERHLKKAIAALKAWKNLGGEDIYESDLYTSLSSIFEKIERAMPKQE